MEGTLPTNFTAVEGQRGFALFLDSGLMRAVFGDSLKPLFYEGEIRNL